MYTIESKSLKEIISGWTKCILEEVLFFFCFLDGKGKSEFQFLEVYYIDGSASIT